MDRTQPYLVTTPGGRTSLLVMNQQDQLPTSFSLMATTAAERICVRLAGGCSGMDMDTKRDMFDYFVEAFHGFGGVVFSGGTRDVDSEGLLDPMVTDLPGAIVEHNPGAIALGTAPRTKDMGLVDHSRLVLGDKGMGVNPAMRAVVLVQNKADGKIGWDGDLDMYFEMMQSLRTSAGFTSVGLIAWNGGGVTKKEIMRSAKLGWPTLVVRGSGRVSDEIAEQLAARDPELLREIGGSHRLVVVDRRSPQSLRRAMFEAGFLH